MKHYRTGWVVDRAYRDRRQRHEFLRTLQAKRPPDNDERYEQEQMSLFWNLQEKNEHRHHPRETILKRHVQALALMRRGHN